MTRTFYLDDAMRAEGEDFRNVSPSYRFSNGREFRDEAPRAAAPIAPYVAPTVLPYVEPVTPASVVVAGDWEPS